MLITPRPAFLAAMLVLLAVFAQAPVTALCAEAGDGLADLRLYLEKETSGLPGRAEIVIGNLDPRLNLSPCARVEPFLPRGTKLWGKALVGLRCMDPPGWTAWLPVEVRVRAPVLIAAGALAAGQSLTERDVRIDEADLTREPGAITAPGQLADRVLARSVAPGQVLRHEHFRLRPAMNQGDPVKVVYSGSGFSVSTEAHALAQAMTGQTVRVLTSSGKILSGLAKPGRVVEVSY